MSGVSAHGRLTGRLETTTTFGAHDHGCWAYTSEAHVHWEQVADRYTTSHPLAPLCRVDRRRVQGIDAVVSAHPLQGPERTVFALYGSGPRATCARWPRCRTSTAPR